MNRLVVVLSTAVIILSIVCGFLFYQLNDVQSVNNDLRSQNAEVQNQMDELQTQKEGQDNQITELQNQNSELQNQIDELQNQNDELQNQIDEQETQLSHYANFTSKYTNLVEIAEAKVYGFTPWGSVTIMSEANVTIENIGVNDVEGLSLNLIHNSTNPPMESHGYSWQTFSLDVLHSGEKREENGYVFWQLASSGAPTGFVTITLKLENVTLDEYIVPNYPN